jgi:hypothetical protein
MCIYIYIIQIYIYTECISSEIYIRIKQYYIILIYIRLYIFPEYMG